MDAEAMHEEALHISAAMIKYGGSFVAHLGYALQYADMKNTRRIKHAFPDYWGDYKKKAADDAARNAKETRIDSMSDEEWETYMRKSAQVAAGQQEEPTEAMRMIERRNDPECKFYGQPLVDRGWGYPVCQCTKWFSAHYPGVENKILPEKWKGDVMDEGSDGSGR